MMAEEKYTMILEIAETAGFCFGVRNAIRQAESAAETHEKIYTYGPLIHNAQAIEDLERKGILALNSMDEIPPQSVVLIRAHGISRAEEEQLRAMPITLIDATCPFVKKIHRIVQQADRLQTVVIFGDRDHPEVRGIRGWCSGEPCIWKDPEEIPEFLKDHSLKDTSLLVVAQTTFDRYLFETMKGLLESTGARLTVRQTICEATMRHQEEAVEIASRSDLMIVLGGKHSSNTRKLAKLCGDHCRRTLFAETADELTEDELRAMAEQCHKGTEPIRIGVTAGASTPDYVIEEAAQKLHRIFD